MRRAELASSFQTLQTTSIRPVVDTPAAITVIVMNENEAKYL